MTSEDIFKALQAQFGEETVFDFHPESAKDRDAWLQVAPWEIEQVCEHLRDDPALAFVVTDPNMFVPEFAVPIREEQAESLGLAKLEDAQIFVIVNKISNKLTANMQGPLVVNTVARVAEQFVLAEKKWTTRHELMTITEPAAKASA